MSEPGGIPDPAEPRFVRALGPVEAASLVVGTVIGSGIFLLPGAVAAGVAPYGVGAVLGVWLACGLLIIAGALCYAELASMFPRAGGQYVFLREAFGPLTGFLYGWMEFWLIRASAIAAVALGFAWYAGYFTQLDSEWELRWTAFLAVFALTMLNYLGVRGAGAAQVLFAATKAGLVGALVVCAFALPGPGAANLQWTPNPPLNETFGGWAAAVGGAMYLAISSFYGWTNAAAVSEELKDPRRDAPRALVWGAAIIAALYLLVNLAYHWVLPLDQITHSDRVAVDVAGRLFGSAGGALAAAVILISAFGSVNGLLLGGPRIYFAMARDGVFFRDLARLHPRFHTPGNAVLLQGLWAGLLILVPLRGLPELAPGSPSPAAAFEALLATVQFAAWTFFALTAAGLMLLRARRPELERRFRTPGYPVTPVLFILASIAFALHALVHHPLPSLVGLGVLALGLPAYHAFRRQKPV